MRNQLRPDLYQRLVQLSPAQRQALGQQLQPQEKESLSAIPSPQQLVAYVVPYDNEQMDATELDTAALKAAMKAKLPTYMVPSVVVPLVKLPLSANGKIDVNALPAPQRKVVAGDAIAPTTETEATLASIWCAVLRLDAVGIHDNFFELGGDSILSIQIVSKAREAGLRLAPNQLFEQPTIAELAAVVNVVPDVVATQSVVTGPVPLTPIQHWFVGQQMAEPYHWHQARVLELPVGVATAGVERAIAALWSHHDALRLRFAKTTTGWQQVNADTSETPIVEWIDISGLGAAEQRAAIEQHGSRLHASLTAESQLMRVACFTRGDTQPSLLLLSLHHWLVDGVSWYILQSDLEKLLTGSAELPAKTTSFKAWAETLQTQVNNRQAEADFWCKQVELPVMSLLGDNNVVPSGATAAESLLTEQETYEVTTTLDTANTQLLLQSVPAAYNTQINDVLLTALTQTLLQRNNLQSGSVLIDIEAHGREPISAEVDLSRTVGWCTMTYPVRLSVQAVADCGSTLKAVKEQLRQVPARGLGYGLMRYLATDKETAQVQVRLAQAKTPEVLFNYLGQSMSPSAEPSSATMQSDSAPSVSALSDIDVGTLRHAQNSRGHMLELNAEVSAGTLQCGWRYDARCFKGAAMEMLAEQYLQALKAIILHCTSPQGRGTQTGGFTPSDFPDADLDQGELDSFISQLTEG